MCVVGGHGAGKQHGRRGRGFACWLKARATLRALRPQAEAYAVFQSLDTKRTGRLGPVDQARFLRACDRSVLLCCVDVSAPKLSPLCLGNDHALHHSCQQHCDRSLDKQQLRLVVAHVRE